MSRSRPPASTPKRTTSAPFSLHGPPDSGADDPLGWTLAWAVVGAFALAVLAMALGPHVVGDNFAETDFYGGYVAGARALQHGHLDPSRYGVVGPGYEVALAILGLVVPDLFLAAELLSVVALTAGLACWALLLGRRASPRLAAVAVVFLAVNPIFFRYGFSV